MRLLRALGLVFVASLAQAVITPSPSSWSIKTPQSGIPDTPGMLVTMGGTGTWTLDVSACLYRAVVVSTSGVVTNSGNAGDQVYVYVYTRSEASAYTPLGNTTCTIGLGGGNGSITVTETGVRHVRRPIFTDAAKHAGGNPPGSSKGSYWYSYNDVIVSTTYAPGGNRNHVSTGSVYTDPDLGGRMTRIGDNAWSNFYTTLHATNRSGRYTTTVYLPDGNTNRVVTSTGGILWEGLVPQAHANIWSGTTGHDDDLMVFKSTYVLRYTFYGSSWTNRGNVYTEPNGWMMCGLGATKMPQGDWFAYLTGPSVTSCDYTNVTTLVVANLWTSTKTYTYNFASMPDAVVDYKLSAIGPSPDEDNYRYVSFSPSFGTPVATRYTRFFRFKESDTTLTYLGGVPEIQGGNYQRTCSQTVSTGNPTCSSSSHLSMTKIGGATYKYGADPIRQVYDYTLQSKPLRLSSFGTPTDLPLSQEFGGGLNTQMATQSYDYVDTDISLPIGLSYGVNPSPADKVSYLVTNVADLGGGQFTLSFAQTNQSTPTWTAGTTVQIDGVSGVTFPNNGRCVVASVTGCSNTGNYVVDRCTFTMTGSITGTYTPCTGSGSSLICTGGVTTDTVWGAESTSGQELIVCRLDVPHCRRLVRENNVRFTQMWAAGDNLGGSLNSNLATYWGQGKPSLSPDGKTVVSPFNFGRSGTIAPYMISTGFDIDAYTQPYQFDRYGNGVYMTPGDTYVNSLITVSTANANASCTVVISSLTDIGDTNAPYVSSTTYTLSGIQKQVKITGLTASTLYNWYAICNNDIVAAYSFVTKPSLSGTGSITAQIRGIGGSNNMVVDWDTTSGTFGNTTSSSSCTSGSSCSVTWSATKGAVYYRIRIRDGSNNNIFVGSEKIVSLTQ